MDSEHDRRKGSFNQVAGDEQPVVVGGKSHPSTPRPEDGEQRWVWDPQDPLIGPNVVSAKTIG